MSPMLLAAVYTILALVVLTSGGNAACRLLFNLAGLKDAVAHLPASPTAAGRYIGSLERIIVATGLVVHSWEAIAAVVAIKTIGRVKELDDKLFAEYFLIGSLFSMFWALVVTLAWLVVDRVSGVGVAAQLVGLLGKPD